MPPQPFKIAVIGSHFVGKSTLCKKLYSYLKDNNQNVGMIGEVVRDCPFPVNEMATIKAQDWILEEQRRREKELEQKHGFIVMDRGVIDNFAYWMRVAERLNLDGEIIQQKENEIFEHSKGYDVVFFIQPFDSNKIKDDNFRSVNPEWRQEMHERVSYVVDRFNESYNTPVFVLKGDKEEVFEQAKGILKNHLNLSSSSESKKLSR